MMVPQSSTRRRACFVLPARAPVAATQGAIASGCDYRQLEALARLLPLLGCGEEAAVLAFGGLARSCADRAGTAALLAIAEEELVHDALIAGLIVALPTATGIESTLRQARRLHVALADAEPAMHLARVAALDAAVCTVLSRLLRPGAPLAGGSAATVLGRIHRDEARHVRTSRALAASLAVGVRLRDSAASARVGLSNVLALAGDAFEVLGVDPARLLADVRQLPDGLFPA